MSVFIQGDYFVKFLCVTALKLSGMFLRKGRANKKISTKYQQQQQQNTQIEGHDLYIYLVIQICKIFTQSFEDGVKYT